MNKITKILICCLVLSFVCVSQSWAADKDDELISKWRQEHRQEIIGLISGFICGETKAQLNASIQEIVRLEILLGTCSKDQDDFYLSKVDSDDLNRLPGEILMVYLKEQGMSMKANRFFEGKTFKYK